MASASATCVTPQTQTTTSPLTNPHGGGSTDSDDSCYPKWEIFWITHMITLLEPSIGVEGLLLLQKEPHVAPPTATPVSEDTEIS